MFFLYDISDLLFNNEFIKVLLSEVQFSRGFPEFYTLFLKAVFSSTEIDEDHFPYKNYTNVFFHIFHDRTNTIIRISVLK